jgi:hypothetical protein
VDIRETPEGPISPTLTIVLDGYNAPVSAGQVWRWWRPVVETAEHPGLCKMQDPAMPSCNTLKRIVERSSTPP